MTEMVERVARAICDTGMAGSDDCTCNPGTCLLPHFNKAARLAIAAMREPTEAMMVAGQEEELSRTEDVKAIFSAMIDAALNEPV